MGPIGGLAAKFALTPINVAFDCAIGSEKTWICQNSAAEGPFNLPSSEAFIRWWNAGLVKTPMARFVCHRQGINLPPILHATSMTKGSTNQKYAETWLAYANYSQPWPHIGEAVQLYYAGLIDEDKLDWLCRIAGVSDEDIIEWALKKGKPFAGFGELITMIRRGTVPYNVLGDAVDRAGFARAEWKEELEGGGVTHYSMRGAYNDLINEIPGPQDLIAFAVHEAWDEDVVKEFGYDDEYPKQVEYWMNKQGFSGDPRTDKEKQDGKQAFTWSQAYWRTHWQVLAPTQAYELMQRCRGDKNNPATWRIPGVAPFTIDDVRRVLKVADYPKPFRDRLAAISHPPISRMDIRRLVQTGVIDQKEVSETYQDHGLTKHNADNLAEAIMRQERRRKYHLISEETKATVLQLYTNGMITTPQAMIRLHRLQIEEPNDLNAFNQLPEDRQLGIANNNQMAFWAIQDVKMRRKLDRAKKWVTVLHRKYVKGVIERVDVIRETGFLGMDPEYVDDILKEWNTEKLFVKRELSASQAIKAYTRGIINEPQLLQRLQNLEYKNQDISIMIVQARQDLAVAIAKAQEKAARTLAQQQKAQLAQIKAAQQEIKLKQAALSKHSSPEKMHKWYVRGFIDRPRVINRLTFLGWTRDDIDRTLAEWDQEIAGKRGKEAEKVVKAIAAARKHATVSDIKKWFKDGVIDEKTLRIELAERGYVKDYSDRVVKDVEEEKHAKASKPSGGSANGEGETK